MLLIRTQFFLLPCIGWESDWWYWQWEPMIGLYHMLPSDPQRLNQSVRLISSKKNQDLSIKPPPWPKTGNRSYWTLLNWGRQKMSLLLINAINVAQALLSWNQSCWFMVIRHFVNVTGFCPIVFVLCDEVNEQRTTDWRTTHLLFALLDKAKAKLNTPKLRHPHAGLVQASCIPRPYKPSKMNNVNIKDSFMMTNLKSYVAEQMHTMQCSDWWGKQWVTRSSTKYDYVWLWRR